MIDFRLIDKENITRYKSFFDYSKIMRCDANFLNMYIWRNEYNINAAIVEDCFVKAYFSDDGSVWGYCLPVGRNVKKAADAIFNDAIERGTKPNFVMLTNSQRTALETMYPSEFAFERSPENQDYIYLTEDLINLRGRKFQAKRNHISRFYKTYDNVRFEFIDDNNKNDALSVVNGWCAENNFDYDDYSEAKAIEEALENMEEFEIRGAVLYVGDKPVAMTLGSEISPDVFDINFEKALREYDGVYAVINNEFAKNLSSYKYINREEDMGIEGLRKAKLSYNPVIILDRYNATLK